LIFSADVNAVNKGTNWTALHCAAFQGHGPVVLSLLRAGSSTDVLDSQSRYFNYSIFCTNIVKSIICFFGSGSKMEYTSAHRQAHIQYVSNV